MRARRAAALAGLALLAGGIGSAYFWAPPLLRKVDWFAAERVEVSGTRLLAPHEVLATSGVRVGANVWTDPAAWEAALRRHPVVAEAEVARDLPRTLRVRIVEKRPVALVQSGILRPATGEGEVLPVDPAAAAIDLPILRCDARTGKDGRIADARTRALLAEAARLAELDPALWARVSEVRGDGRGGLELRIGSPAATVALPAGAPETRLVQLRAALDDLARRTAGDTARIVARVDARWEDQVVVRM